MEHPGKILLEQIRDRGWTQKQFASFVGKKNSEVNELIKGKRNITVQWDIILSEILGTPEKYWINMQVDYDYNIAKAQLEQERKEKEEFSPEIIGQNFEQGGGDTDIKVYDKVDNSPQVGDVNNILEENINDPDVVVDNIVDDVGEMQDESQKSDENSSEKGNIENSPTDEKNDEIRKRKKLEKILLNF